MDIYTQLRDKLRLEYDHGATDQEIADRLGCSHQQVNRLRNGTRTFSKMRLETLLKLFPKLTIALDGMPIHGTTVTTINGGNGNIIAHDVNGNNITLPATVCAGEIENFRSGLLHGFIDLEIDDATKVTILRFVRDFNKR